LRVWVTDDGAGGASLDKGHGLRGLEDRLLAAGGRLRVTSPNGGPTTITAELPCC
jgi:signal transduction histidine kinase